MRKSIIFPSQNNPKNLDPSHKMDLDFSDCFGGEKLFNSQISHK